MTTATIEAEDFFTAWQLELDAHLLVLAQAGRGKDHLIRRTTDRIIDDLAGLGRSAGMHVVIASDHTPSARTRWAVSRGVPALMVVGVVAMVSSRNVG